MLVYVDVKFLDTLLENLEKSHASMGCCLDLASFGVCKLINKAIEDDEKSQSDAVHCITGIVVVGIPGS